MSTASNEASITHLSLLEDIILHENDLTEQAKSHFSFHSQILHAFESYRQSILSNEHITRMGRHSAFLELNRLHTNCKSVLNYMAEHFELLSHNLPAFGPLVICGLPRTGSTLLQNLLACDPVCRTPLFTDMRIEIVPPISPSDFVARQRRMAAVQLYRQKNPLLESEIIEIFAAHPFFSVDEDFHILRQASLLPFLAVIKSNQEPGSDTWLSNEMAKDYTYDYHEVFLRMLNSVDPPRSHWLLKAPVHSLHLETLIRHYPNAAFIMTHRRLDEVLPSFCSLGWAMSGLYLDKMNQASRETVTTQSLQLIDKMIECIMKFRTRQDHVLDQLHKKIFDVAYNDLMVQPIVTVHRIYDHFGLPWSDEFEVAMHAWLRDNPQGSQGRHSYSLTECGQTREDIEIRYSDYINLFQSSLSSDTANASSD